MSTAPNDCQLAETLQNYSRFFNLRGVRWRINLGILSSSSSSIEELRRAAADCRRRYASLRRRLLINPHLPKDGSKSPDLSMDNPLSQNPDSTWDRFFRNAELEKLLDQDLSRLYPEYENYFQSSGCQNMLRRVLLVWCLRHPEYGYRQGMHELLAPLLYVLHMDLQFLSQIRSLHEDCFNDEFDHSKILEGDLTSNYRFTKDLRSDNNDDFQEEGNPKITTLDDLDPQTKELFLLSDAYGAEGELGVILSERFIEHDAYCMFDSLMIDTHGVVAMADFFSPSSVGASCSNLPPVIEASSSLYHLLSIVDPSLHSHLIELGVEPQYFALRWLRVLFGREFSLDDLLLVWDELFSSSNASVVENAQECCYKLLCSPRGVFIAAMAVAMLLHLRSSLLATENATSCLQRLLNFPKNICVEKLILKAKSWQALALETNLASSNTSHDISKQEVGRLHHLPGKVNSPKSPSQYVPESYWEEKWRVMHKENATQRNSSNKIKKMLGDKFGLLRTESDPSPSKKDSRSSNVRRSILDDLTKVNNNLEFNKDKVLPEEHTEQSSVAGRLSDCTGDETCLSGESSSVFSTNNSPHSRENDHDNVSEKSSVTSNSVVDHDEEANQVEEITETSSVASFKDAIACASNVVNEVLVNREEEIKQGVVVKDRKLLSGKLQWILRLGRGNAEGTIEKGSSNVENTSKQNPNTYFESSLCGDSLKTDIGNKNMVGTIKNLGQSMLDNIQVIESVFQQDQSKGKATAMAALMELRKVSNMLLEM